MSDRGEVLRVPAVRFVRRLPSPIERVWDHVTKTDLLTGWFGEDAVIEPREGGRISFMDGHIRGVVTRWNPPAAITYTWNVFNPGQTVSDYPESYLSLTLAAEGDDVVLTLLHLPVLERFEAQNAMGWHTFLDMVGDALAGTPKGREAYRDRNAAIYGVDLGNLVR